MQLCCVNVFGSYYKFIIFYTRISIYVYTSSFHSLCFYCYLKEKGVEQELAGVGPAEVILMQTFADKVFLSRVI